MTSNTPIRLKRGSGEELSENFGIWEFECKCGDCPETVVDPGLIIRLEAMRKIVGPITITDGYRCAERQEQLRQRGLETAKGISQHELGRAADIFTGRHDGPALEQAAREVGFESIGVGRSWIHVDTRPGFRAWGYVRQRKIRPAV